jgi:hypothetical protein
MCAQRLPRLNPCDVYSWGARKRINDTVDCVWNVMAHTQKPDFVFRRNGRVHLNRQGRQFSRLLAGELCTSASRVCTARAGLCSAVLWRLLVTHSILLFPLHFSSRASPCAITFQTQSTNPYNEGNIKKERGKKRMKEVKEAINLTSRNFGPKWTCSLSVVLVCERKETISSTFSKYDC